jgi:SAM-dependent methyltransferase
LNNLTLISPDDGTVLNLERDAWVSQTGIRYPIIAGIPDLRPRGPIAGVIEYELQDHQLFREYPYQQNLSPIFSQQVRKFDDLKASMMSGFIPLPHPGAICLDHGCGGCKFRTVLESYGYRYVGVDNESGVTTMQGGGKRFEGGATHWCDLHRLPFLDNLFQFAVSYSVFEHLQLPFVAAKELFRVMEPGGVCFVAVAATIPFHMDSFYHHTHLGVVKTFSSAGFEIRQIAPADWNAYIAISDMDGLPGPKWIRNPASNVIYRLHLFLWYFRAIIQKRNLQAEETRRKLLMPGIIKAILVKPS